LQDVINGCVCLGQHLAATGRFEQAVKPYGKALALVEKFEGQGIRMRNILLSLGALCCENRQYPSAERFYNRALEVAERCCGASSLLYADVQVTVVGSPWNHLPRPRHCYDHPFSHTHHRCSHTQYHTTTASA